MIPENTLTEEAKYELKRIEEIEKMKERENLVYTTNENTYSFKIFKTINTFGKIIYNGAITLKEADKD